MARRNQSLAIVEKLTLELPATAADLAKLDLAMDELGELRAQIEITDDASYSVADEILTTYVQAVDGIKTMRSSVTGPVYAKIKEVEARFRPTLVKAETGVIAVKKLMGDYRLELARAEAEARQQAQQAAQSGDADALVQSLNDADTLAKAPEEAAARCSFRWRVKKINPELLPDEWWCPDEARIQDVATAHRGAVDDPPVIPGVTFEPVAVMGAKH